MPARALPRQLDVGSDGPQPWLGVVGRSERPHQIHIAEDVMIAVSPLSGPAFLRAFVPEVIQILPGGHASVVGHWTSRDQPSPERFAIPAKALCVAARAIDALSAREHCRDEPRFRGPQARQLSLHR